MRRIIQVKLGLGLRSSGSLTSIKEVISEVQWKRHHHQFQQILSQRIFLP